MQFSFFSKVKTVIDYVDDNHADGCLPYNIEEIKNAIINNSSIDHITFIPFSDPDNPIKGRYQRYAMSPGPYCDSVIRVDIHYNSGMNTCWTRFVVCKEMCHSLEDGKDVSVSSEASVDSLVEALLSPEQARQALSFFGPFISESMAHFAALELLCPIKLRKKINKHRLTTKLSDMQIATEFRIPVHFINTLFDERYIELVEEVFTKSAP